MVAVIKKHIIILLAIISFLYYSKLTQKNTLLLLFPLKKMEPSNHIAYDKKKLIKISFDVLYRPLPYVTNY